MVLLIPDRLKPWAIACADSVVVLRRGATRKVGRSFSRRKLVSSLARPGGNLTGVNFLNTELAAKQFELLREILPKQTRIAVLVDPADQTNTTSIGRQ
jgi:ABC-type uncharacterized transport system substrate-binding protein